MPRKDSGRSASLQSYMSWIDWFRKKPQPDDKQARRYLEFVRTTLPDVDLINQSLSDAPALPLKAVFLPPRLSLIASPSQTSPPANQTKETHTIWNVLFSERPFSDNPIVLLGEPGSGKTTLLRHVAHEIAQPSKDNEELPPQLPTILTLHQLATPVRTNGLIWDLADAIMGQLAKRDWQITPKWVRQRLDNGGFLVLLDGLDEIIDGNMRTMVYEWLMRQMEQFPQNRFVLATRPFAYRAMPLPKAAVLQLNAFTVPQVEQYIRNWYRAVIQHSVNGHSPNEIAQQANRQAESVIRRMHRRTALVEMAGNPLLLRMMLDVQVRQGSFSEHRIRLFQRVCAVWLGGWRQAQGVIEDLTAEQKKRILQVLAFQMSRARRHQIPFQQAATLIAQPLREVDPQQAAQFLQMVSQASGLLVAEPSGHYRFAHHTMQDYLTAVHVQQQQLERFLLKQVEDEWWHRTILFYAALTQNPMPIVNACLDEQPPPTSKLTLMERCLDEFPNHAQAKRLRARIEKSRAMQTNDVRLKQAEVIKTLHLQEMIRLEEGVEVGYYLVPNAMYQLYIEARRKNGQLCQPDQWDSPQYPSGEDKAPVLGVRAYDAQDFCRWLNENKPPDLFYRLPLLDEAKEMLLQSGFWRKRQSGTRGFWVVNADNQLSLLVNLNDNNQWQAESNFIEELAFDLKNLSGAPHERAFLEQHLHARVKKQAYAFSSQAYLLEPVSKSIHTDVRIVFDRNVFGTLLDLNQKIDALHTAVGRSQLFKAWQEFEEELAQQAGVVDGAIQLFRGQAGVEEHRYMLDQRLTKLAETLRLRPSFMDQILLRRINEANDQVEKTAYFLRQTQQNRHHHLRQQLIGTLFKFYQQHGERLFVGKTVLPERRQALFNFCQTLYIDLLILKGRTEHPKSKRQPPVEGVRLIRERVAHAR